MKYNILWLEDDAFLVNSIRGRLQEIYSVKVEQSPARAEKELKDGQYHLVIIDLIIAIHPEDIKLGYTPEATEKGTRTGLAFYERNRELLRKKEIQVLVYTKLGEASPAKKQFVDLGLKEQCFITQRSYKDVDYLLKQIDKFLTGVNKTG